jgi:ribosomal protein S13
MKCHFLNTGDDKGRMQFNDNEIKKVRSFKYLENKMVTDGKVQRQIGQRMKTLKSLTIYLGI